MENIFTGDLAKLERTDKYCVGQFIRMPLGRPPFKEAPQVVTAYYANFFAPGDKAEEELRNELIATLDKFDPNWRENENLVLCREEEPYLLSEVSGDVSEPKVIGFHFALVDRETGAAYPGKMVRQPWGAKSE